MRLLALIALLSLVPNRVHAGSSNSADTAPVVKSEWSGDCPDPKKWLEKHGFSAPCTVYTVRVLVAGTEKTEAEAEAKARWVAKRLIPGWDGALMGCKDGRSVSIFEDGTTIDTNSGPCMPLQRMWWHEYNEDHQVVPSNMFRGFTPDLWVVTVGSAAPGDRSLDVLLEQVKAKVPDAYIKTAQVAYWSGMLE